MAETQFAGEKFIGILSKYVVLPLILILMWYYKLPEANFWNIVGMVIISLGGVFITGVFKNLTVWTDSVKGLSLAIYAVIATGFLLLAA